MYKIIIENSGAVYEANDGELLSELLIRYGEMFEHPCSGKGICKKCTLTVDGESVLSCQYKIKSDIVVELPEKEAIATADAGKETGRVTKNMCLCLDIGTTTLHLALVSADEGAIVKSLVHNNPQRALGADVMSRIEYASRNGVYKLQRVLIDEVNQMIDETGEKVTTLYVAGNTTMLHTFFGIDPSDMGQAPYTPVFLDKKRMSGEDAGIRNVREVISLPNISAFVGADITAGLNFAEMPCKGKYNFLIDLGTNAEVVLYGNDKLYCTAAAAGPCFEGVNISSGMSATEGAIYSYTGNMCLIIGGGRAKGICATGLIDAIAVMLEEEIIDETGFMEEDFEIKDSVKLTQGDIRQFQLAKSSIYSAVIALLKKAGIDFCDIDKVFVSGGFSSEMNLGNAIRAGLLPEEVRGRFYSVNNSCLGGLVKYACEKNDLDMFLKNAEYVDLASDKNFQELFIENMMF
ncbi:MAG: DUF4445 domain-containing protein [Clostridia bacterium]|nr:DUF4445 domain-containing protein [Clostridia bacterium]